MDAPMKQVLASLKTYGADREEDRKIVNVLLGCDFCPRCVLRYLGVEDPGVFRYPLEDLKILVQLLAQPLDSTDNNGEEKMDNDSAESTTDIFSTLPCPACLGILQQFMEPEFLNRIKDHVHKADFDFSNYICSLTVPVCLIPREHAFLIHLKEKFEKSYAHLIEADIPSIKDAWKWRNGPLLNELINAPFDQKSKFEIALTFTYEKSDKECYFLADYNPDLFRKRKNNKKSYTEVFTRTNVAKALYDVTDDNFKRRFAILEGAPGCKCVCEEIKCTYDSVFIAGRYNKYSRTLSQTPWICDGKRKSPSSVEEEICGILKEKFKYEEGRFSSSGREDVDVRMLGSGRPFVIEMVNPRRVTFSTEEISQMQKEINANSKDVQVRDLQFVARDEINQLKEGEMEKVKTYVALCWSESELSEKELDKLKDIKDLTIFQKTPIRVLHRRPLATRERTVYKMSAEKVDNQHFKLYLSTQAGTYIKEFVHGDFGRTKPNMSTLCGTDCDILELDVQAVELDWPKKIDDR